MLQWCFKILPIKKKAVYLCPIQLKTYAYENSYTVEFNPAGVEPVPTDASTMESARYSLGGHRLAAPEKGLNIVKYSDGTAKKIVVR